MERVVDQFPPKDTVEITAETDTPLISHCKLGSGAIREILNLCRDFCDGPELAVLEKFIENNNSYNEPMTLLLRRTFRIKRAQTMPWKGEADLSGLAQKAAQHS